MTPVTAQDVRSTAVYLWPDRIVVHPQHRTVAGFWISGRSISPMAPTDDISSIGLTVRGALRCSLSGVPVPDYRDDDWKALQKETWKAAGRRSLRSFMTEARYVGVRLSSEALIFEPTCNGDASGKGRGFTPIPDAALRLMNLPAPEVLGNTLIEAWKQCLFVD
jgi:hypothetical protein